MLMFKHVYREYHGKVSSANGNQVSTFRDDKNMCYERVAQTFKYFDINIAGLAKGSPRLWKAVNYQFQVIDYNKP